VVVPVAVSAHSMMYLDMGSPPSPLNSRSPDEGASQATDNWTPDIAATSTLSGSPGGTSNDELLPISSGGPSPTSL